DPLHVAGTKARGGAERVGVVGEAAAHDRDRLETAMRMAREARHDLPVVHPPAVAALEVLAEMTPLERCRRAEALVAGRGEIVVIGAEQKRVDARPRKPEASGTQDHVAHLETSDRGTGRSRQKARIVPRRRRKGCRKRGKKEKGVRHLFQRNWCLTPFSPFSGNRGQAPCSGGSPGGVPSGRFRRFLFAPTISS